MKIVGFLKISFGKVRIFMIKRLAKCIKGYTKHTILSPLFIALEVVIECIIPLVTAALVNSLNSGEALSMDTIKQYGLILVCLAVASLCCGALSGWFCATASCGFAKNLREKMFNHIQTFSFANIDKFSTAGLVTRLTTDITHIQMAYQMSLRMFTRAPASLICAMAMAFYINPRIASIYLIAVVFACFLLICFVVFLASWKRGVLDK